ncbi:MAG TPA: polysaccharide deacetylase family protein [Gemmatimonadaceae bacterium]
MRSRAVTVHRLLILLGVILLALLVLAGVARRARGHDASVPGATTAARSADELGRIPIFVYHEIGDTEERWQRERERFRADLELLHDRGYRPIGIGELVDGRIPLPAGTSPVVVTFDDASPSQFGYLERDGALEIDPESAVGIWLEFARSHPEWRNRAAFCVLTGAGDGHAMFGERGIDGQRTEWRHAKLRHLVRLGFELCGHTATHANLGKLTASQVSAHIARGLAAIDSAVPGERVRAFALPFGAWPEDRSAVRAGRWRDPTTGRVLEYRFDAILEAWGGTVRSPFDPAFDPLRLTRVQATADLVERTLDQLDRDGRYVSDGDPGTIARRARPAPAGTFTDVAGRARGEGESAPTEESP